MNQYNDAMITESVFRSARSVGNTLVKLANDKEFETSRPLTHKTIASLAKSYDVRGALTPNQKQLAYKLITQQIPFITAKANARVASHVVAPVSEFTESDDYEELEREAIQAIDEIAE